ncbi:MAG: DUF4058 family protein [Chloroflexi bacterium]|nr:DUF4058 family protein [Chloroflexota bacterium]MCI0580321.1 DUF4058 family protein [Chloroflexota bacterium]MCI0648532.1 DUF4058 family protein [Chloroflexota bacterium]MCI0728488.1 DUF4058 family protein [Chloroflexota bacterium]
MDPYLEHPALWPDVHNRLIAAIADVLSPLVAPNYYVGLERRTYLLKPDDVVFIGRPDVAIISGHEPERLSRRPLAEAGVLTVDVPMNDEVGEYFLEVHEVTTGRLVTILELLSPVNKLHPEGRREYEEKRGQVFKARTNLVEVDLLRAGEPMAVVGRPVASDYRILVSRGSQRPRAQLYAFNLRQPIPDFPLPLLPGDEEPIVGLNEIVNELYSRARFDLRLDYKRPPVPPLRQEDVAWAQALVEAWQV